MQRRSWLHVGVTVMALGFSGIVCAGPPAFLNMFRPNTQKTRDFGPLELKDEHGPYMVLAAVLDAEDAQVRATALAEELRKDYGLKAYVHNKRFDYSEGLIGAGINESGGPKRMKYADDRSTNGFAVMVGDFATNNSPDVEETLKIVKLARPKSLGGDGSNPGKNMSGSLKDVRSLLRQNDKPANTPKGLMWTAFITRNPLLPQDFFQPPKVDKFVKDLNSQVDFSLLENGGRFTLRVATFRGEEAVVMDGKIRKGADQMEGHALEKAGEMANLAVEVLRKQGIEAYQFHDRTASFVTVGSFPTIGSNDQQGQFIELPEITEWKRTFGGAKDLKESQYGQVPVAKTLLDVVSYKKIPELNAGSEKDKKKAVRKYSIPFDPAPVVMAVPKADKRPYAGSLLGSK